MTFSKAHNLSGPYSPHLKTGTKQGLSHRVVLRIRYNKAVPLFASPTKCGTHMGRWSLVQHGIHSLCQSLKAQETPRSQATTDELASARRENSRHSAGRHLNSASGAGRANGSEDCDKPDHACPTERLQSLSAPADGCAEDY